METILSKIVENKQRVKTTNTPMYKYQSPFNVINVADKKYI